MTTSEHSPQPNSTSPVLYGIFHLNLAFSSIEESQRQEVIRKCYHPLLDLIETSDILLGIEATVYTLETIRSLDPGWIFRLQTLIQTNHCELIGSGDSQIIGPLVPAKVNVENLRLGQQGYQSLLGITPEVAYINEQAVSSGLLDHYIDCGFKAVIMEWDNARSIQPRWQDSYLHRPVNAEAFSGRFIPVLWNWSISFQKLQRVAHGLLCTEDYQKFIQQFIEQGMQCFPIYGNDAEIFDFRPGRFEEEAAISHSSEWNTLATTLAALPYPWCLPSDVIKIFSRPTPQVRFSTSESPIVVKKQKKYNISRWAVSGRNDLWLNSKCFQIFQDLKDKDEKSDSKWQKLCRIWASDYRTFITDSRYKKITEELSETPSIPSTQLSKNRRASEIPQASLDKTRNLLHLRHRGTSLILNLHRGGAIKSLSFKTQEEAVIGTLDHGHFKHIWLGSDFFSNHLVLELIPERRRITDLSRTSPQFFFNGDDAIGVTLTVATPLGNIQKKYSINGAGTVECSYSFPFHRRPEGVLRLGTVTLLNTTPQQPIIGCHHGGCSPEFYSVTSSVDHTMPASTLVTASNGLGATEGLLWLGIETGGVLLTWNPGKSAVLPLLTNIQLEDERLTRIHFSMAELDETFRTEGTQLPFSYTINPWDGVLPTDSKRHYVCL